MLKRYSSPETQAIWSDANKYQTWLLVELYALEAYQKINKNISAQNIKNLWTKAKVDVDRIYELEQTTKHDVVAFIQQISETLGSEKKWFHFGLTSTDVVDTAQSVILQQINKRILTKVDKLLKLIKDLAIKHQHTFQIGRTHGVHAEVTTFGYKLLVWYDEVLRQKSRFERACQNIEVAKISGAVGNYANIPLEIQRYVAEKLQLQSSRTSTQTLQRDRHAEYIFSLVLIASSLDKFAIEIRHLQRTEVQELKESFAKKQKGSSAMPHKNNPIASENISGLSRVMRGYLTTAMENIPLWHERDISHSSSERIILADATMLMDYMLERFTNILNNLEVNKQQMKENIFLTQAVIFSQRAMLMIIEDKKWSRTKAYDLVQKLAHQALAEKKDFGQLLIATQVLSQSQIEKLYDLRYYTKNIDKIFKEIK